MDGARNPVDILPFRRIEVELFDPVRGCAVPLGNVSWQDLPTSPWPSQEGLPYLETIRMLVAGPFARLGVKKKSLLIFLTNVVIQVLRNGKLAVELNDTERRSAVATWINLRFHGVFGILTCSRDMP